MREGLPLAYAATRDLIARYEIIRGPIEAGTTAHMDHVGCGAGNDTKARLYVTRKVSDSGQDTYLCYCHNCGRGSALRAAGPPSIHTSAVPHFPAVHAELELPRDLVPPGTTEFPLAAADFLAGTVSEFSLLACGVGYDRESGRLILPIYEGIYGEGGRVDSAERLLGWQARRLTVYGPKYITVEADDVGEAGMEMSIYLWGDQLTRALVLVEDWLSAMKVAENCPGAVVVPLFRYKISAERLARLRKHNTNLVVWLDDDRPEVKDEAAHIRSLWRALGGVSSDWIIETDPKHIDGDTLGDYFSVLFDDSGRMTL